MSLFHHLIARAVAVYSLYQITGVDIEICLDTYLCFCIRTSIKTVCLVWTLPSTYMEKS